MSAEKFPYVFIYPVFCHLCGTSIDKVLAQNIYGDEMWRGYSQELTPGGAKGNEKSQLIKPELCPSTFLGEPKVVHYACWEIVKVMTGSSEFSELWLNGFLDCLSDIAPFLPEIQFKHSPDQLDQDLTEMLSDASLAQIPKADIDRPNGINPNLPQLPGIAMPVIFDAVKCPLAGDVDSYILSSLERGYDLPGSVPESLMTEDLIEWLMFAERIRFNGSFPSNGTNEETSARLGNAMRNIKRGGPARFPHTANYNTVWKNATKALARLKTIPIEQVGNGTPLNGKRAKLQTGRTIDVSSISSAPVELHLRFSAVSRQHYIKHGNDSGMKLGAKYLRDISFEREPGEEYDATLRPSSPLCGIRFIDDNLGVLAVHLKTSNGWEYGWQQDPDIQLNQSEMAIYVSQSEWELGAKSGSFVIVSDTEKDRKLVQE